MEQVIQCLKHLMCKRIQPLLLYTSVIQLEQTVLVTNSDLMTATKFQ